MNMGDYDYDCHQVSNFTDSLTYDDNADAFFDTVENQQHAWKEDNGVRPKVHTPRRDSGCPQSIDATAMRQTRSTSASEATSIPSKICTSLSDWNKNKDANADQMRRSARNITKVKTKIMDQKQTRPVSVGRIHERTRSASMKRPASMESRLSRSHSAQRNGDVKRLSNPQRLTVPQTPLFVRRERNKVYKPMKTQEEIELEKVADYRKQLSAAMKKSKESLKSALSGQPPVTTLAPLASTRPQMFNFATDQRIKTHPMQTSTDPQDFASGLRSHPKSLVSEQNTSQETRISRKRIRSPTKVEPFHLHDKKRKPNSDSNEFHSVAEQINSFARKTPDRFHSKTLGQGPVLSHKVQHMQLTMPETPQLETRRRERPRTVQTFEELEDKEVEEMKRKRFKAQPVDENAFKKPFQPHKSTKEVTKTEAFKLDERRTKKNDSPKLTQEQSYTFHAQPVAKDILTRTVGVKKVQAACPTIPKSPAFSLRKRVKTSPAPPKPKEEPKPVLSHPMHFPGLPMKPKLEHFATHAKPFSFEERNRRMQIQKEDKIKKIIQDEKKGHEFYAKPLPILESPAGLPIKQTRSPTRPKPFKLKVEERGSKKAEEWGNQVEEDLRKQRELVHFQARDPAVLYSEPFIPQKSTKPLTDTMNFQLNTKQRKDQRNDWESYQKQKELELMESKAACEKAKKVAEEKEVQRLRAGAVHPAQPIRHYKPVDKAQTKPVTQPHTPKFSDRLRLRSART